MTSGERMRAAISGGALDYPPCAFMIFSSLRAKSDDDLDFIRKQIQMGLDVVVELATWGSGSGPDNADLPGPFLRFHPEVSMRDWTEDTAKGRLIHRRYDTPAGPLTTAVRWTEDWRYGPRVPLLDDWVIPRAAKVLVETDEDLDRLVFVTRDGTAQIGVSRPLGAAPAAASARPGPTWIPHMHSCTGSASIRRQVLSAVAHASLGRSLQGRFHRRLTTTGGPSPLPAQHPFPSSTASCSRGISECREYHERGCTSILEAR